MMKRKLCAPLLSALTLTLFVLPASHHANAQTANSRFSFRAGQSMYIVAFRRLLITTMDSTGGNLTHTDHFDNDLDAERKVRQKIEEWRFFRVVDKPSEADFVFLVNLEDNSIEGLAIPFDAYTKHYKEKYDTDALRDAAYGRYMAGPLNLPTISRLSDRLVKQFRESVSKDGANSR